MNAKAQILAHLFTKRASTFRLAIQQEKLQRTNCAMPIHAAKTTQFHTMCGFALLALTLCSLFGFWCPCDSTAAMSTCDSATGKTRAPVLALIFCVQAAWWATCFWLHHDFNPLHTCSLCSYATFTPTIINFHSFHFT